MFNIPEAQAESINRYVDLLVSENTRQNLVRFSDKDEIFYKHIQDSLLPFFDRKVALKGKAVDIGSGAGFPGIVLGICFPNLQMTLFESEKKKAGFLLSVIQELSLANCRVIADRVESVGRPESYDYVFARAVSSLPVLLEYAAPLLRVNGKACFFKGPKYREEMAQSTRAIRVLHWSEPSLLPYTYEHDQQIYHHVLLSFEKLKRTPQGFPRKPGTAAKTPL